MKIVFLSNQMDSVGGVQRVISTLSKALTELGHTTLLLSKNHEKYFKIPFHGETKKLKRNEIDRNTNNYLFKRKAKKYIEGVDAVIDFRPQKSGDILSVLLASYAEKMKVIHTVHNPNIEMYLGEDYQKSSQYLSKASAVICPTQAMKEDVKEKYGLTNTKVLANPINLKDISTLANEAIHYTLPERYIVCCTRLHELKGIDLLLRAFKGSALQEAGINLIILGEGDERAKLESLSHKLFLTDQVIFMGQVNNPHKYVSKSLFSILTSRYEALSCSIQESLACEVPVISFDCISGPRYVIKHMHNGILVPPYSRQELKSYESNRIVREDDINGLRSAMNKLYLDTELRKRLSKNCRSSVCEFDITNILNGWENLLFQ